MIFLAIAPQVSLAETAAGTDSNEINTKQEIQNNNSNNDGVVLAVQNGQLTLAPSVSAEYAPINNDAPEDPRDIALAKFEEAAGQNNSQGQEFTMNATAYTAARDETGNGDGITASGLRVKVGETLACPERFPFGTKVRIRGMGTYVCEDRGGAIHGDHFDIYMQTKSQAYEFGRRRLEAQVVM